MRSRNNPTGNVQPPAVNPHAWRKKPRRFAPKSNRGCKTCRIRRIKCDENRPSCLKCQHTGRTCDGYEDPMSAPLGVAKLDCLASESTQSGIDSVGAGRQRHAEWTLPCDGIDLHNNARPLLILSLAKPVQGESMRVFEDISLKHMGRYQPSYGEHWRKTLMLFAQTIPSVRHAAIALGLLHRKYLFRPGPDLDEAHSQVDVSGKRQGRQAEDNPLVHYNRSIQLLLEESAMTDGTTKTLITLLVCYLFICFDHLAGNDMQAMKHVRAGMQVLHDAEDTMNQGSISSNSTVRDARSLIRQVRGQLQRFDMQALMFVVDWTPATLDSLTEHQDDSDNGFRSMSQAVNHMEILIAQVMRLYNARQGLRTDQAAQLSSKDVLLDQLRNWSTRFDMLQASPDTFMERLEATTLSKLLWLQHGIATILLSCDGANMEMEYDAFLLQFRQCFTLADEILLAHAKYNGSEPLFTPEIGVLPALYIIGTKCRHPTVRRDVIRVLRRQLLQEAVWNSMHTAAVIERMIEIEEDGMNVDVLASDIYKIPIERRINVVSWIYVVSGDGFGPRLDLNYRFCKQEGINTEVLQL